MDYASARANMVESQLRTNKVTSSRVLDAFSSMPRELFVPEARRGVAYIDEDIEVGPGRFVMEPMVLARLLQAADLHEEDVALEIGCGTGYGAALMARMVGTVVALEEDAELRRQANANLAELGLDNAVVVEGDLRAGYPKQAPYNMILISGAVSEVPEAISAQLAEDGRLLAVIKPEVGVGLATILRPAGGRVSSRPLFDASIPLLPGFERKAEFRF